MYKRSEVEPLIISEWLKRSEGKRTMSDIYVFYNELKTSRPDLLSFRSAASKYQILKSILKNHIVNI